LYIFFKYIIVLCWPKGTPVESQNMYS